MPDVGNEYRMVGRMRSSVRVVALVLACSLVAAGCGSAYTADELAEIYRGGSTGGAAIGPGAATAVLGDVNIAPGESDGVAGAVVPQLAGPRGTVPGSGRGESAEASAAASSAPVGSGSGGGFTAPGAERSEIVLASVGHYSGLAGASLLPAKVGIQVWERWVNANGGIGGRPVRVIVEDDNSDVARHVALVRDLVENRGVIAFVANFNPLTGQASVEYLQQKQVPVIGGSPFDPWYATSPIHFSTGSAGDGAHFGAVAAVKDIADREGLSKLGIIVCAEADACTDAGRQWARHAEALGMDVVYNAQSSLVQPDFTGECLAARRAGAEIFMLSMAANGNRRVASSCARQSYEPLFATVSLQVVPEYVDDENLDGLAAGATTYPWFLDEVEPAREFQAAMAQYQPEFRAGGISIEAWAAGELLRRALGDITGEATSASVLEGLYSVRGETLRGLTIPLTFERDQPNPQRRCWWVTQLRDRVFTSPNGGELQCG